MITQILESKATMGNRGLQWIPAGLICKLVTFYCQVRLREGMYASKNLARNPVFVCFCGNMRSKVILQRVCNSLCGFHGTVGSRRVHHAILSKYRAQRQACQTQHFRCMRRWMNCANVYLYSNPWPLCFHELSLNAWTFFASLDPFRTLYLRKILFFCLSLSLPHVFPWIRGSCFSHKTWITMDHHGSPTKPTLLSSMNQVPPTTRAPARAFGLMRRIWPRKKAKWYRDQHNEKLGT